MFNKNVGGFERVMRVIAGAVIISLAFWGPKSPWAYFGMVPLFTGLTGWCPPYALFGRKTCSKCR